LLSCLAFVTWMPCLEMILFPLCFLFASSLFSKVHKYQSQYLHPQPFCWSFFFLFHFSSFWCWYCLDSTRYQAVLTWAQREQAKAERRFDYIRALYKLHDVHRTFPPSSPSDLRSEFWSFVVLFSLGLVNTERKCDCITVGVSLSDGRSSGMDEGNVSWPVDGSRSGSADLSELPSWDWAFGLEGDLVSWIGRRGQDQQGGRWSSGRREPWNGRAGRPRRGAYRRS